MSDPITRSGVSYSVPRDSNREPIIAGVSTADGVTILPGEIDPTTGAITVINATTNGINNIMLRTPNVFKTITPTASGNTALWTPITGKKFRLMGYTIDAPDDVQTATATDIDVTFNDNGTAIGLGFTFWAPDNSSTSSRHMDNSGVVQLGNGYLSTTANNVLNVNLSATLTLGKIRITVWGTEE